jgi:integrase
VLLTAHVERLELADDDLVFPQPKDRSKPFTPGYVQDRADEAWTATELERVTLHECRHGYRSFLDAAGISEARADRYLGHASSSIGRRYTHSIEGQLTEDAKRLDEYLSGAVAGKVVAIATGAPTGARRAETA